MSSDHGFVPLKLSPVRGPHVGGDESRGFVRGHSAGYAAGLRAAEADTAARAAELAAEHARALARIQEQLAVTVASLNAAVDAVNAVVLPIVAEAEDVLLDAAVELAEAVVGASLRDERRAAQAALDRALAPSVPGRCTVRMNPADLDLLDAAVLARSDVDFAPDPTLQRGDAIADFEHGYLDARIATALERARAALAEDPQ